MDPMIRTGQPAPDFELPDLEGYIHRLSAYRGKVVVVNFWSAACPHSARADREILAGLERWGEAVVFLPVAANADEPPHLLRSAAGERGLPLVLCDSDRQVAGAYGAATTPHLFVIDPHGFLRYQGALNDVTFRRRTPTRSYLLEAVEAVLSGLEPDPLETPPYGCTIVRYAP
jgi:peroxiredoxin